MQSLISAQSVTLFMFIYCYCGNSITVNCEKIAYGASHSFWYEYPVKYQQYVKQIILRGQKPFYLTGYEIVKCSFETFKSVSMTNSIVGFCIFFALMIVTSSSTLLHRHSWCCEPSIRIEWFYGVSIYVFNWMYLTHQDTNQSIWPED